MRRSFDEGEHYPDIAPYTVLPLASIAVLQRLLVWDAPHENDHFFPVMLEFYALYHGNTGSAIPLIKRVCRIGSKKYCNE